MWSRGPGAVPRSYLLAELPLWPAQFVASSARRTPSSPRRERCGSSLRSWAQLSTTMDTTDHPPCWPPRARATLVPTRVPDVVLPFVLALHCRASSSSAAACAGQRAMEPLKMNFHCEGTGVPSTPRSPPLRTHRLPGHPPSCCPSSRAKPRLGFATR